jgi:hypothetical protein
MPEYNKGPEAKEKFEQTIEDSFRAPKSENLETKGNLCVEYIIALVSTSFYKTGGGRVSIAFPGFRQTRPYLSQLRKWHTGVSRRSF